MLSGITLPDGLRRPMHHLQKCLRRASLCEKIDNHRFRRKCELFCLIIAFEEYLAPLGSEFADPLLCNLYLRLRHIRHGGPRDADMTTYVGKPIGVLADDLEEQVT